MELLYKPDWEETKQRINTWWAHEETDRCLLAVLAPKSDIKPAEPPALPEKMEDRWLDFDYLHAKNEYTMSRTFYGGEWLPIWSPGYPGWDMIPSYLGADVELHEQTGWIHPMIDKGQLTDYDYRDFVIAPDSKWWVFAEKMHRFAVEEARGKCLPGIQAIGGCGDTLASMRGTENLLIDLIECPEYIREFETYLMKQWMEVYEKFYQIIKEDAEGSTFWGQFWSPGRTYSPANDFAYMISPDMFNDIFLPIIEMQTNYLDHTIYHVDGIGNFSHVDSLCELPKLTGLDIMPGEGKPSALHFMDMLKKIQKAKKNLSITLKPEEVETALGELSSKGLAIWTFCDTEGEARELLENAKKWSKVRKV